MRGSNIKVWHSCGDLKTPCRHEIPFISFHRKDGWNEILKSNARKMTISEIEKELGYKVEIISK